MGHSPAQAIGAFLATGTGLGSAANDCIIPDPTFATEIAEALAKATSTPPQVNFALATGDPIGVVGGGDGGGGGATNPTATGFGGSSSATPFSSSVSGISAASSSTTTASSSVSW